MNFEEAKYFLITEFESDYGLLIQFRISDDVGDEKIDNFIQAIHTMQDYYKGKKLIDRYLVNILNTLSNTLQASASHWTKWDEENWPKGLNIEKLFSICRGIDRVFSE